MTGNFVSTFRAIQAFIQYAIPDVPEWVEVKIEREKYVAKQKMFRSEMGDAKYDQIFDEQPQEGKQRQHFSTFFLPHYFLTDQNDTAAAVKSEETAKQATQTDDGISVRTRSRLHPAEEELSREI